MAKPDKLPPVINILLDESTLQDEAPGEALAEFARLLSELRDQAVWTAEHFSYTDTKFSDGTFVATASGSLNPFAAAGGCAYAECKIADSDRLANSIAVYADVVTVPDMITATLFFNERLSDEQTYRLTLDMLAVRRLAPLIRAGVVRFTTGMPAFCEHHRAEFVRRVDDAVPLVRETVSSQISYAAYNGHVDIFTGKLYAPSLVLETIRRDGRVEEELTPERVAYIGETVLNQHLRQALYEAVIDLNQAGRLGATLFSGSRLDMVALRALEGLSPNDMSNIEVWEASRSFKLPWLSDLSPTQVLQLREECQQALPRFRERVLKALSASETDQKDELQNLREEALELASEIEALDKTGERRFRNVAGSLGMTIAIYGFAAGFMPPAVALGSLMSLLGLLHGAAHKDEQEGVKLTSKPAYVLFKAAELRHVHGSGG